MNCSDFNIVTNSEYYTQYHSHTWLNWHTHDPNSLSLKRTTHLACFLVLHPKTSRFIDISFVLLASVSKNIRLRELPCNIYSFTLIYFLILHPVIFTYYACLTYPLPKLPKFLKNKWSGKIILELKVIYPRTLCSTVNSFCLEKWKIHIPSPYVHYFCFLLPYI